MIPEIPPALFWILGALLLPALPRLWRPAILVAAPALGLATIIALPEGAEITARFLDYELVFLKTDGLSRMFGIAFGLVGIAAAVYAWHVRDLRQQLGMLFYSGGGIGVVFAGDFFTLLIFWEIMAVASAVIVWTGGTKESGGAGYRYLMYHVVGGSVLLGGIVVHVFSSGSIDIVAFANEGAGLGAILILIGVLVNTGFPPLHSWLPDAYPRASIAGSVFLSAFTTKTAVYVLARCFPGWDLLFIGGVVMALYGVCYAMFSNDIRQILSYHIISQVGYMVAAIGIGGDFAINGASAYAYNHLFYKALLFMGAGAIIYTVGESRLTHLGGLARKMPWIVIFYLVGGASISGIPLFNGFVSKGMVTDAASAYLPAYYLLNLASVGTFLSVGVKLPYFAWFYRDRGLELKRPVPRMMVVAMGFLAFMCLLYGIAPQVQFTHLPFPVDYSAYQMGAIAKAMQLQIFTFVVFWFFREQLLGPAKVVLDLDWFYRRPAGFYRTVFVDGVSAVFSGALRVTLFLTDIGIAIARNPVHFWRMSGERFDADRDRAPLGPNLALALLVAVVLSLLLIS
ncbi:MAG TPA: Na(+)/H(+) antiporter subunit D [Opitutales bacterium]|nr:Na(+)/H(+) antiporter subunit D [Opitutales bacterium]